MRLALLQLNATIGAFDANRAKLEAAYKDAVSKGAELVLAPELFLCGYPPRDLLLRDDFISRGLECLDVLAKVVGDVPLITGYVDRNPVRPGRALRNAAAVIERGKITHRVMKCLLPTYDVFDEDRYFEPAEKVAPIELCGHKIALTICEDIWNDADFWPERRYRTDPVHELVRAGATLVINISASPWQRGKEATRLAMLQRVARDERVPLVQVNTVGANDELIFDGHSVALNAQGEILAVGASFAEEVLMVAVTVPATGSLTHATSVEVAEATAPAAGTAAATLPANQEEQLYKALVLGVRDYVAKCRFKSVVLGLSGGIDSALVAVIAAEALGPDKVWGVSLPSRYSSEHSLGDAAQLAKKLGIRYDVLPIGDPVADVEKTLAGVFKGRTPDSTEENIQSRMRGLLLMALSNKFGPLVLTTGNKSELAVGYCTLYGDMCGALAPIADVLKTEIYELAHWVNRNGEIIPWNTIEKPPSAELRPNQTDQDSLPPYDLLDRILRHYVVDDADPRMLVADGIAPETVKDVLNKITFSEYKRRQAAPGLKVSPRAFGMGRRVPIAQGFRG
ncbi:MAG TPA: NAD+ synthase [Candidatus Methylacidiphilales bacterium]|jgi:NAD+ synthetase|nr:NAD+ synthase [Candidatus Methylacidiphilales bacterium]